MKTFENYHGRQSLAAPIRPQRRKPRHGHLDTMGERLCCVVVSKRAPRERRPRRIAPRGGQALPRERHRLPQTRFTVRRVWGPGSPKARAATVLTCNGRNQLPKHVQYMPRAGDGPRALSACSRSPPEGNISAARPGRTRRQVRRLAATSTGHGF